MKLFHFLLALLSAFVVSSAAAATTSASSSESSSSSSASSSSVAGTTVWVTITTNGGVAVVQTEYSQSFPSFFTSVSEPSSGDIGLGSLSGSVGEIRTYSQKAESSNHAHNIQQSFSLNIYGGLLGGALFFIGLL